jgi:hypothetical protein
MNHERYEPSRTEEAKLSKYKFVLFVWFVVKILGVGSWLVLVLPEAGASD